MPILANVLIKAEEGHISLTTTNLDLGIRCQIAANVEAPGAITLPVRKLATIVKSLPSLDVEFDASTGTVAQIISGGSQFRVTAISEQEFPLLPTFEDQHVFQLEQGELLRMLKCVSYGQSQDENRHILNGVYLNFAEGKLTLVATDGRRLALKSKDLEVSEENGGNIILPARTVNELERLLGIGETVKIAFNEKQVAFSLGVSEDSQQVGLSDTVYLVSKVVEGSYPNYQQVIPKETESRIKIDRELLAECVSRAGLVVSEKNSSVKLRMTNNLLEITGASAEYGESHESMAIAYEGAEVNVAFNPDFILDPLRALAQDEVYFEFKDDLSPGVFKTLDNFLCVIMPLRLQ